MFDIDLKPLFTDLELEELTVAELAGWDADDSPRRSVPDELEAMSPGPLLSAVLNSIDDSRLNGHDLITVLRARAHQTAHDQAAYYHTMGEVAKAVPTGEDGEALRSDEWYEYTNMEIRAALALTRRAADSELGFAYQILERLPSVWAALSSGSIDVRRAVEIVNGTTHLEDESASDVADRVLADAGNLTTGQLRARIRRLCIEIEPIDALKRLKQGLVDRTLYAQDNPDGTSDLMGLRMEPHKVRAATRRINAIARKLKEADDARTYDQIRADVYLDLLTGDTASTQGKGGVVDIHVDLKTLAELDDAPGDLAGYGPVVADIARQVADTQRKAEWRTRVTDRNGAVVHTGITRRRPDAGMRRRIEATYPRCTFPGCRMPATECDIDHIEPWAESRTTEVANLAPLCRRDHVGRHEAGWTYQRQPDGRHRWASRLGHTYVTDGRPP